MITITPDIKKLAILLGENEGDIANSNFNVVYGDKEEKSISLDTVIDDGYKVKYQVSYNNEKLFNSEFNIKKTGIIIIDKSKIQAILRKNLPIYI